MKLQSKVLVILASLWAVICLVIYVDSKVMLEAKYKRQEEKIAFKDIDRLHNALQNKLESLKLYTNSWSQWDDAYSFVTTLNQKFIKSNYVPATFTSSNINFFLFYNSDGKLHYGKAYDLQKNEFIPIPAGLLAFLSSHRDFVVHNTTDTKRAGIAKIPEGLVVLDSLPVLTSNGDGPVRGSMIMGYYLSAKNVRELAKTVEAKVDLYPYPLVAMNETIKKAAKNISVTNPKYQIDINRRIAYGYLLVKDIDNKPVALMQMEIHRWLYSEGAVTIKHYSVIVLVLGVAVLITMWFLLKKLVLNRILKISKQVIEINRQATFGNRIEIGGHDELHEMADSLNSMLELIELTQEQLKYRISRRTQELEKLSSLNRNLFSEMSKQKTIEAKLRKDEKQLKVMAYYDALTGLPNRAFFFELLQNAITHAQFNNNKLAVLFIDVDKFKKINDTYGHEAGDKFLKQIALRLKQSIGTTDVAARLAGDEFIAFLGGIKEKSDIDDIVERIFGNLIAPIFINDSTILPMYSIGISIYPDDGETIDILINNADLAMYYAKKHEGNTYYYFSAIDNHRPTTSEY